MIMRRASRFITHTMYSHSDCDSRLCLLHWFKKLEFECDRDGLRLSMFLGKQKTKKTDKQTRKQQQIEQGEIERTKNRTCGLRRVRPTRSAWHYLRVLNFLKVAIDSLLPIFERTRTWYRVFGFKPVISSEGSLGSALGTEVHLLTPTSRTSTT